MLQLDRVSLSCVFAFSAATCLAQTPATFRTVTSAERPSYNPLLVDLNNDGIPDLVQRTYQAGSAPGAFTVRLANGYGSFGAPVTYTFPYQSGFPQMLAGDFNGDGNVDLIIVPQSGSNQLLLFLGNGDGTLQAPKIIPVDLPAGQTLAASSAVADFNGDGKLDLAVTTESSSRPNGTPTGSIELLPGDGAGNFGAPIRIYTPPVADAADALLAGDFDGDGKADIAFLDDYYCDSEGPFCTSTLHVLYNDGNSTFTDIPTDAASTTGDEFWLSAGDLNSDGRTDIIASVASPDATTSNQVYVLYGQSDRAFHLYTITAPNVDALAMADFNGDTKMDLVGTATDTTTPGSNLIFFLAGDSEGAFTQQSYALPYDQSSPIVGDLNADMRPDALVVTEKTTSTFALEDVLNTTAGGNWGSCAYPQAGQGIHVCVPQGTIASPDVSVRFNASANSFGNIRKMELWVDGAKIAEQYHTWGSRAWFDFSVPFPSGSHRGVIFASDIDNHLQQSAFTFNVGQICSPPASAGVRFCSPVSGSTVSSPVTVQAGTKVTGTPANLQVWVDGKWYANIFDTTTANLPLSLSAGTHRIAVLALNTAGQKWESAVNVTVK